MAGAVTEMRSPMVMNLAMDQTSCCIVSMGLASAAHRANHRATFPDMRAAARQKRRCTREDEQNGSQIGVPGISAPDNGQTEVDGSDFAEAVMHAQQHIPMFCCI